MATATDPRRTTVALWAATLVVLSLLGVAGLQIASALRESNALRNAGPTAPVLGAPNAPDAGARMPWEVASPPPPAAAPEGEQAPGTSAESAPPNGEGNEAADTTAGENAALPTDGGAPIAAQPTAEAGAPVAEQPADAGAAEIAEEEADAGPPPSAMADAGPPKPAYKEPPKMFATQPPSWGASAFPTTIAPGTFETDTGPIGRTYTPPDKEMGAGRFATEWPSQGGSYYVPLTPMAVVPYPYFDEPPQ